MRKKHDYIGFLTSTGILVADGRLKTYIFELCSAAEIKSRESRKHQQQALIGTKKRRGSLVRSDKNPFPALRLHGFSLFLLDLEANAGQYLRGLWVELTSAVAARVLLPPAASTLGPISSSQKCSTLDLEAAQDLEPLDDKSKIL